MKVLYIAGWGRSGSTVLASILGHIDGFFSTGELRYIWDRGVAENWLCGCGAPFRECALWTRVLDRAFGGTTGIDTAEMVRQRESVRTRHLPLAMLPGGRRALIARLSAYRTALARLYQSVLDTTVSRVIVDSSKFPSYAWVLGTVPGIDLYVVHLVRDPRGVAYSWLRKKPEPGTTKLAYMQPHHPVDSSVHWDVWNLLIEAFWRRSHDRYLLLRYEDFVREPEKAVERILGLLQEDAALSFIRGHHVELGANHTVSGNPSRFATGTIELRPDVEWQTSMRRKDRAMVTALTWPWLLRYCYPS